MSPNCLRDRLRQGPEAAGYVQPAVDGVRSERRGAPAPNAAIHAEAFSHRPEFKPPVRPGIEVNAEAGPWLRKAFARADAGEGRLLDFRRYVPRENGEAGATVNRHRHASDLARVDLVAKPGRYPEYLEVVLQGPAGAVRVGLNRTLVESVDPLRVEFNRPGAIPQEPIPDKGAVQRVSQSPRWWAVRYRSRNPCRDFLRYVSFRCWLEAIDRALAPPGRDSRRPRRSRPAQKIGHRPDLPKRRP